MSRRSPALVVVLSLLLARGSLVVDAHSGASLAAPTKAAGSIVVNGTIDTGGTEAVWAPGVPPDTLPNSCAEFNGIPPAPPVTVFALNDGVNLFLAFDIPDHSAQANDQLFLYFDRCTTPARPPTRTTGR